MENFLKGVDYIISSLNESDESFHNKTEVIKTALMRDPFMFHPPSLQVVRNIRIGR